MIMGKTRTVKEVNLVVAILFLLLLALHLYIASKTPEWNKRYEVLWPNFDMSVVRPVLGFCTGYTLLSCLFYLLKARIDMVYSGGRHLLRWIMAVITVLLAAVVLLFAGWLLGINPISISANIYLFLVKLCNANWLWALLGVYWFVSLNTNRVLELPDDEEDEEA